MPTMNCALVGSRFFGATVFEALRREAGVVFTCVVAPAEDDRLAAAARAAGVTVHVLANPRIVPGEAIAEGTDLILAAHTHARVSDEALARARLGGVGYHPSLLPRHRGIAAVEWTILAGDPIAGGSVYHLADGWDAGAIAAQDWCFVDKGETARELWERALAPMGLALLARVVREAAETGRVPATTQDTRFATRAPMLKRSVVLTEDGANGAPPATTALVVTVMGPDRPGIVNQLADRAQRHGANWTTSHLTRLAGEFAGMVHLDVPHAQADALAEALHALNTSGLQVVVARSGGAATPAGWRTVALTLVGDDRLGIVSRLTSHLVERGVSIEQLHTELGRDAQPGQAVFHIQAQLLVPAALDLAQLSQGLGSVAHEMQVDINLGELGSAAAGRPAPAALS
jgi:glycine cleavage system regulatory protein